MTGVAATDNHLVGRVADVAASRGWFFGQFMAARQLQSSAVEVAWQHLPGVPADPSQAHTHTDSVEINIVIAGELRFRIDGHPYEVSKGDFYVNWPGAVISELSSSPDAEVIVVRAPSVNDKTAVPPPRQRR